MQSFRETVRTKCLRKRWKRQPWSKAEKLNSNTSKLKQLINDVSCFVAVIINVNKEIVIFIFDGHEDELVDNRGRE